MTDKILPGTDISLIVESNDPDLTDQHGLFGIAVGLETLRLARGSAELVKLGFVGIESFSADFMTDYNEGGAFHRLLIYLFLADESLPVPCKITFIRPEGWGSDLWKPTFTATMMGISDGEDEMTPEIALSGLDVDNVAKVVLQGLCKVARDIQIKSEELRRAIRRA